MKKIAILILSTFLFTACTTEEYHSTVIVKHCDSEKIDTLKITHKNHLRIDAYKEAVPILKDGWDPIEFNVCEFTIIRSYHVQKE